MSAPKRILHYEKKEGICNEGRGVESSSKRIFNPSAEAGYDDSNLLSTLERLSNYVRYKGFPLPYTEEYLGQAKFEVIY